jgi:hypothetical protein
MKFLPARSVSTSEAVPWLAVAGVESAPINGIRIIENPAIMNTVVAILVL